MPWYIVVIWITVRYAFAYMNLIEHWGSGIPRIIDKVKAAGLREPEFIGGEVDLRINIQRGQIETNNATNNANGVDGEESGTDGVEVAGKTEQTQIEKLLQAVEKNPSATQAYYVEQIGVSKRTVSRMFVSLKEKGVLIQCGTTKKSKWVIKKQKVRHGYRQSKTRFEQSQNMEYIK